MNRLRASIILCAVSLPIVLPSIAHAQRRGADTVEESGRRLVTPETQRAIDQALAWLASQQDMEIGSFRSSSNHYRRNVAVTSLCGLAFLASGSTPGRGPYGKNVNKVVDYILSQTKPNGYIINERHKSHGPMYGHGFSTLFLAEVYGMSLDPQVKVKLEKAVQLIINSQHRDGGWRYNPQPEIPDVSVTVCQLMALRAARNAGISVPKETVDKCIDYVKRCQNADGGFRYQLTQHADSRFPRSAAGVVAFYNAGIFEGPAVSRGLNYLKRHAPHGDIPRYQSHYFYGHYYAIQAMWHAGGSHWEQWYPAIRNELLNKRYTPGGGKDGYWTDHSHCHEYATAMALLILQTPNNYLPIFQR